MNPGIAYALSLLGLVTITASLSVMLWALEPLLILLLAAWFLRERVTPGLVILSLIAVAGMLLVIYQPGGVGSPIGVLLTVAGVVCCAVYTVITRRWISTSDSTAQVVVAQQAYALVLAFVLVAAAWILGGAIRPEAISPVGWASAIGSGVHYYGLAYWLYLSGLRRVPASIAAASLYLIPIFGVAGGFVFLGERLEPSQWAGAAIVVAALGVILVRTSTTESFVLAQHQPVAGSGPLGEPPRAPPARTRPQMDRWRIRNTTNHPFSSVAEPQSEQADVRRSPDHV